ncbi:globin domain-containing protein [Actinomadura sp. DC4]|uniref:globin domain-containing protein n=1 Tax=Actinomadura sp. DC4 TaxID=3055069 RepID=UPI0025B188EF|nr:globin domain-containing protein [Actinomadura sp. DC4]MDN3356623.1 FAD-binding oxidoreductase [Actinomadura sp. DC4]
MDAQGLKDNFAQVAQHGDAVALFFYSDLFLRNPGLRDMFPIGMSHQRDRLLSALGRIVSQVDNLAEVVPFVRQLGADHRKFGVEALHYPEVGQSLVATLRYFSGAAWNEALAKDWTDAYTLVANVMVEAADEDAKQRPPWWNARVIAHERRRFDLSVLRVVTDRPLPYEPGQSVALEVPASRPRMWRYYSMANAPRPDNTLDFHVRLVDGGPVSPVLVRSIRVGDWLKLGPPIGTMTFDDRSGRDVLLIGGSTGLAPLKAILERIAMSPAPPRVHLFFGARTADGLYDLDDLSKRAAESPWLTVVPAVSDEQAENGAEQGALADVVARFGLWRDHDAYVCGSPAMVDATVDRLARLGLGNDRIRADKFADA